MNLHQRKLVLSNRIAGLIAAAATLVCLPSHADDVVVSFTNAAAIPIYDYYPATASTSTIAVSPLPGGLQSVTVSLYGLSDANTSPIELLLQSPSGQGLDLMYGGGSGRATGINLTFDDNGGYFGSGALTSGTYAPSGGGFPYDFGQNPLYGLTTTSALAGFVGPSPVGTWTLSEWYGGFAGSDGTIAGGWSISFTVYQGAPTVTTLPAFNIGASNATLSGVVVPNDFVTSNYFQYGFTTNYGQFSATNTLSADLVDPQTNSVVVSVPPGSTIHYQSVAQNSAGTNYGGDLTFVTPVSQIFVNASVTNLSTLLLTVNGNIGSNYVVLGSTNLGTAWVPIVTNTLTNSAQPIYVVSETNNLQFFEVQQQ